MGEEVKVNSKEKIKDNNEAILGESNLKTKKIVEEGKASTQAKKKKKEQSSRWNFPDFIPPSQFPTTAKVKKEKKQFLKFVELIKKINVNISLANLIGCVPKYAKFVKEITANKVKFFL